MACTKRRGMQIGVFDELSEEEQIELACHMIDCQECFDDFEFMTDIYEALHEAQRDGRLQGLLQELQARKQGKSANATAAKPWPTTKDLNRLRRRVLQMIGWSWLKGIFMPKQRQDPAEDDLIERSLQEARGEATHPPEV